MADRLELTILRSLCFNEEFARKVIPFIKEEYFEVPVERRVFEYSRNFINKYNKLPTPEALIIEVGAAKGLSESEVKDAEEYIDEIRKGKETEVVQDWLLDQTEQFCKDQAVRNTVITAIKILNGEDKKLDKGAIPQMMSDALAVCFDPNVGHDYLEDGDTRYDFMTNPEERIPFRLAKFNEITKGGVPRKTLNLVMAGTGVGKTIFLCEMAADYLMQGLNVAYFTLEMREELIAQRIDANLMNITLEDLEKLPKNIYQKKLADIRSKTKGKLLIKEYSSGGAHAGHFRHALNEARLKKSFKPDVIIVDYIGICASSRIKRAGDGGGSYFYLKSVAEELRGLGQEFNAATWSAAQTSKGGYDNTEVDLKDTAESFALPMTADFMFVLISTEELEKLNQLMVKQLKNRYYGIAVNQRFCIGCNKAKMKMYDIEDSAQNLTGASDDDDEDERPRSNKKPVRDPEKEERVEISKKHGSESYKPAYRSFAKSDRFKDFKW